MPQRRRSGQVGLPGTLIEVKFLRAGRCIEAFLPRFAPCPRRGLAFTPAGAPPGAHYTRLATHGHSRIDHALRSAGLAAADASLSSSAGLLGAEAGGSPPARRASLLRDNLMPSSPAAAATAWGVVHVHLVEAAGLAGGAGAGGKYLARISLLEVPPPPPLPPVLTGHVSSLLPY